MRVAVNQLGLAAYIKLHGSELVEVHDKTFIFETNKPLTDWWVQYSNSCCMRHDALVCELRPFLQAN